MHLTFDYIESGAIVKCSSEHFAFCTSSSIIGIDDFPDVINTTLGNRYQFVKHTDAHDRVVYHQMNGATRLIIYKE